MLLSVVSVEGISNKKLKHKTLDYFYNSDKKPSRLPYSILLRDIGMNVLFLKNGMIFDSYKDLPVQKEFVMDCVSEIFGKTILAYQCTENCDWLEDINNIKLQRI